MTTWSDFVREPLQLWLTDRLAQRYCTRPSTLLGVVDPYAAYCFDQTVMTFCAVVQGKVDDVPERKGKKAEERREREQKALLAKYLRIEDLQPKQKFRDPAEALKQ